MAFKETQTLTRFLFIWLSFIEVSSFVTFNEEIRFKSVGSFNTHARGGEAFNRRDENPTPGAQIGRLIIWKDQTPNHNRDDDGLSSDLGPLNRQHDAENAYQSDDAGWMKLQPLLGQVYGLNTLHTPVVERLLGMRPKVDCVGDLMKLTVHGNEAFGSNFLIDRGTISPLPLSQLPSECGHTLLRTWRDFVFIIPYNGCYVSQERDTYILPLLWWGLPVKMSCSSPTLARSSPTVSCYTNGMIVKLQKGMSMNLKVKVMNEWQPLMSASAKCGYSLVSHPDGVVIHAPYMPCTETKDGMFTLSMATEREFNLSCPALSLGLPLKESDIPTKNDTSTIPQSPVSSTISPTTFASIKTTQAVETPGQTTSSSTMQKLSPTPLPYQPYFKPVIPNYPFLFFHPKVPPTVVSQDPKSVVTPSPITQGPHTTVYPKPYDPKPPQTWYPWYPKPNIVLAPDPTQMSLVLASTSKPLLPPIKAHKPPLSPLVYLLKPTTVPPQDKTTAKTPPVQWPPMYPPSGLLYPLYPRKPELVDASSAVIANFPHWLYSSQSQKRPDEPSLLKPPKQYASTKPVFAPPIPAPTRKAEPVQLLHYPWYKPFPQRHLEMPSVPTKVPQVTTVSTPQPPLFSQHPDHSVIKGPPITIHFDFPPSTDPTPAPSKITEQVALISTPTVALQAQFNLSHARSFHCPTFCPGPPSVSYHHHNHHHFGHPFPVPYLGSSSLTKITAEIQSPPVVSTHSTTAPIPFFQGMGYNYGLHSSKGVELPPAVQHFKETEIPFIRSTPAPDTSELLTRPTMCPHIFRTLASRAVVSSQSAMKPVNIASFIRPWEPTKPLPRSLQNAPIAEPLAHSVQSPKPAVYHAEMQPYVPPWGHHTPMFVAPNKVGPFSQSEHRVSLNPTMPPANGKNLSLNYWYQAASYARPPMSDAPAEMSFKQESRRPPINYPHKPLEPSTTPPQPKQTHKINPPMQLNVHPSKQIRNSVPVHTQLYEPQSGEPPIAIFRASEPFDSFWVPAVQSNQKTLHSTYRPDDSMRDPLQFSPRRMERLKQH